MSQPQPTPPPPPSHSHILTLTPIFTFRLYSTITHSAVQFNALYWERQNKDQARIPGVRVLETFRKKYQQLLNIETYTVNKKVNPNILHLT